MDLIEFEEEHQLSREEAAALLRTLADSLARHNSLEFLKGGIRYTVEVPDRVEVEVELEIGEDGSSLEIEINW
jgi:amphi-Trp domain-containing protein